MWDDGVATDDTLPSDRHRSRRAGAGEDLRHL